MPAARFFRTGFGKVPIRCRWSKMPASVRLYVLQTPSAPCRFPQLPFVIEFPFVLGRPAPLPDPWTTAPDACVLEARRRFEAAGFVPAGFTGRVGLMLVEHDGIVRAEALLEPCGPGS